MADLERDDSAVADARWLIENVRVTYLDPDARRFVVVTRPLDNPEHGDS